MKSYDTIDAYIADYPEDIQKLLTRIRTTIHEAEPEATEAIKYGLPTFQLFGNLVHFGAFSTHIGFYPAPSGIEEFQEALKPYQKGKGTIQFPLDGDIPLELITKIVKFRAEENRARHDRKKTKK